MKNGLYKHSIWDGLIVKIRDNCIVDIVSEPTLPSQKNGWLAVRHWWYYLKQARRPFSDEEIDYFIKI